MSRGTSAGIHPRDSLTSQGIVASRSAVAKRASTSSACCPRPLRQDGAGEASIRDPGQLQQEAAVATSRAVHSAARCRHGPSRSSGPVGRHAANRSGSRTPRHEQPTTARAASTPKHQLAHACQLHERDFLCPAGAVVASARAPGTAGGSASGSRSSWIGRQRLEAHADQERAPTGRRSRPRPSASNAWVTGTGRAMPWRVVRKHQRARSASSRSRNCRHSRAFQLPIRRSPPPQRASQHGLRPAPRRSSPNSPAQSWSRTQRHLVALLTGTSRCARTRSRTASGHQSPASPFPRHRTKTSRS